MNLEKLHNSDKAVSAKSIFKTENGSTIAIRIQQNEMLTEHITKVPALLVCLKGKAVFETENGEKESLSPGDYLQIQPMVKHWVSAYNESNFLLIKS